jgi:hypothetical protein
MHRKAMRCAKEPLLTVPWQALPAAASADDAQSDLLRSCAACGHESS